MVDGRIGVDGADVGSPRDGVNGGKWYSLIDKVDAPSNFQSAFGKVRANDGASGVDHQSIEQFEKDLSRNIERLSDELTSGSDAPQAVRRVWILKPGSSEQRPLGIPTVRDRVVLLVPERSNARNSRAAVSLEFAPPVCGGGPCVAVMHAL